MIEDDFYRSSSQYRLWSFTRESLNSIRANTNAIASERVRAAQRRAKAAVQSNTPSATGTPTPTPSDAEGKPEAGSEKEVECLTPEEELELVQYYCEQTLELGGMYKEPLPTTVRATAIQYLRRFYLTNSVMTYPPKSIMACALFLATKTDNYHMPLQKFAAGVPGEPDADEVIAPEFTLTQGLRFTFDVRHPFRGLEGGVMELQAIAQGNGQPGPHHPGQTPESLKRAMHSIAPVPGADRQPSSIIDRIARAHHTTREILKHAAQMTDAYFLYTPSQIWLSAFLLADKPLAEFYIGIKVGPTAEATNVDSTNPLSLLRHKLLTTLADCSKLLESYKPMASDPEKMKALRRIAKKLRQCQDPEKSNAFGKGRAQKRDSGGNASAATPAAAPGEGISESEQERAAKKRKLERERREREARELFGGELVAQRAKEGAGGEDGAKG